MISNYLIEISVANSDTINNRKYDSISTSWLAFCMAAGCSPVKNSTQIELKLLRFEN